MPENTLPKTPKIFIIEDDLNNHPLFQKAFADVGFSVTIRKTADGNFIDEIAQIKPDIISMDIMIWKEGGETERDGLEATRLLKLDPRTKDIPVIILTNFSSREKIECAKEYGAADFISLQAHRITEIPPLYLRCLTNPAAYEPSNPLMRT